MAQSAKDELNELRRKLDLLDNERKKHYKMT